MADVITLLAAKGSPGVTTTALALAAVTNGTTVEADPSGGDILILTPHAPTQHTAGLTELATDLSTGRVEPARRIRTAPAGLHTIPAPASPSETTSALLSMSTNLIPVLATLDTPVWIDAGRWTHDTRTSAITSTSTMTIVVLHPTPAGVLHTRMLLDDLRRTHHRVCALTIGNRPYNPDEVATALDTTVIGSIDWDPRGVNVLLTLGPTRAWHRSRLARTAKAIATALTPGAAA